MDWFLYDNGLRHERANDFSIIASLVIVSSIFIAPTGLDLPQIISIGSRECTIEISPPIRPNGIIIKYLVYFDAILRNETKFTVVQIYGLQPYTSYQVHVAACTKVGCVNSTATSFATYEEGNTALLIKNTAYFSSLVMYLLVRRQKVKSQNSSYKKTKLVKFSEKLNFFAPRYTHVLLRITGKKCFVLENVAFYVFLYSPFEICPLALLSTDWHKYVLLSLKPAYNGRSSG